MMAILLAAPASGLGQLLYFCTMTGEVGPKCCCQYEAEVDADASESATLAVAPCCMFDSADQQLQPTRVEVVLSEIETQQFVALPYLEDSPLLVRKSTGNVLSLGSRGPPPDTGPPLFIKYCSYLI
jgi:hypothetical protein